MIKIIFGIINHPLNHRNRMRAFFRFISFQFISRIYRYPILLPFTSKTSYLCWNGLTGLTGNWYYGLMEMEEMSFILHFLREEDCFFDIGANVGAYTILASQHSMCEVHAFEPHPNTFRFLQRNIRIQENQKSIFLHNFALGSTEGVVSFTANLDTVNHIAKSDELDVIDVDIKRLGILNYTKPTIIKIDVEGFEWNVLMGCQDLLIDSKLKGIIIELNGSGARYGFRDDSIDELLREYSFAPFTYDPFQRKLIPLVSYTSHNTIYIRDLDFCIDRLKYSKEFRLASGVIL